MSDDETYVEGLFLPAIRRIPFHIADKGQDVPAYRLNEHQLAQHPENKPDTIDYMGIFLQRLSVIAKQKQLVLDEHAAEKVMPCVSLEKDIPSFSAEKDIPCFLPEKDIPKLTPQKVEPMEETINDLLRQHKHVNPVKLKTPKEFNLLENDIDAPIIVPSPKKRHSLGNDLAPPPPPLITTQQKSAIKLKPLAWQPLPKPALHVSLWETKVKELQGLIEVNESEIETLFRQKESKRRLPKQKKAPPASLVSFLTHNATAYLQHGEIKLKPIFKLYQDHVDALLGDILSGTVHSRLTMDDIQAISDVLPTHEHLERFDDAKQKCRLLHRRSIVDTFWAALLFPTAERVAHVKFMLSIARVRGLFKEPYQKVRRLIETQRLAMRQLMMSRQLALFLLGIRSLGNILNRDIPKKRNIEGFRCSSVLSRMTFPHEKNMISYVLLVCERSPHFQIDTFFDELSAVSSAATITLSEIKVLYDDFIGHVKEPLASYSTYKRIVSHDKDKAFFHQAIENYQGLTLRMQYLETENKSLQNHFGEVSLGSGSDIILMFSELLQQLQELVN